MNEQRTYKRSEVTISVSNGKPFAYEKATHTAIPNGSVIEFCEAVSARIFWANYAETKKYNPSFGKKALLQSALMKTANYPCGFALNEFRIIRATGKDAIIATYTVTVQ